MSLFVGRIASSVTRADLEELFGRYGRLDRCEIKAGKDHNSNFAFIQFISDRDAEDALRELQRYELHGKNINVEWSKESGRFRPRDHDRGHHYQHPDSGYRYPSYGGARDAPSSRYHDSRGSRYDDRHRGGEYGSYYPSSRAPPHADPRASERRGGYYDSYDRYGAPPPPSSTMHHPPPPPPAASHHHQDSRYPPSGYGASSPAPVSGGYSGVPPPAAASMPQQHSRYYPGGGYNAPSQHDDMYTSPPPPATAYLDPRYDGYSGSSRSAPDHRYAPYSAPRTTNIQEGSNSSAQDFSRQSPDSAGYVEREADENRDSRPGYYGSNGSKNNDNGNNKDNSSDIDNSDGRSAAPHPSASYDRD